MADLVVTPANVGVGSSAKVATVLAGEAIDRGEWVYYDALTSKYMRADNTDADRSVAVGQAQSAAAADGDYFILMRSGEGIPGATLNLGEEYYLSSTPGKAAPFSDLNSGDYVVSLFRATSTSAAEVFVDSTGIQL